MRYPRRTEVSLAGVEDLGGGARCCVVNLVKTLHSVSVFAVDDVVRKATSDNALLVFVSRGSEVTGESCCRGWVAGSRQR